MEFLIVCGSLIVVGALIVLDYIIASNFAQLAQIKGYDYDTYFHWCFWLGAVGWCMVAALPDSVVRERLFALQNGEKTGSGARGRSGSKNSVVLRASADDYSGSSRTSAAAGAWTCSCGKVNAGYVSSCVCGKTKIEAQNKK